MSWILRDKEFEAVLRLPGDQRYSYLVKKAADEERVWSLVQDDGWALMGGANGPELVPIWPHERFAAAAATLFPGHQPQAIPLEEWLEVWIPGMIRDGRQVAVFPTAEGQGPVVQPTRIAEDLRQELLQYE